MKASAAAHAAISADGLFSLVLPGTWASIPLTGDKAAAAQIAALVKRQVGMNDRLASRRRQLRDELTKSAQDAAEQGAIAFQIALEIIAGVPFPGSIMSRLEGWPAGARGETLEARLASGFPAAVPIATDSGPGVRVAETGVTKYVDETTPSLSIDYWIPAPSGEQLLVTTVQLPTISEPDVFIELFDTVMSSILWAVPVEPEPAAVEAEPAESEPGPGD